jgi:hypothetical protein
LTPIGIRTKSARERLYKKLCSGVGADKQLLQDMKTFYDQCATCNFVTIKREVTPEKEVQEEANPSKRSRPTLPYKFSFEKQWPAVMEKLKIFNHLY